MAYYAFFHYIMCIMYICNSLLTESMSSMVSANSGIVSSVDSTALASAARNLLGERGKGILAG